MRRPSARSHPERVPFRIGLLNMPRLLADVVCSAFEPEDVEFEVLGDTRVAKATNGRTETRHDAVIACVRDGWDPDLIELKRAHPGMVVMGIDGDGRRTWIYQLFPRPCSLGGLGPRDLRVRVLNELQFVAT